MGLGYLDISQFETTLTNNPAKIKTKLKIKSELLKEKDSTAFAYRMGDMQLNF